MVLHGRKGNDLNNFKYNILNFSIMKSHTFVCHCCLVLTINYGTQYIAGGVYGRMCVTVYAIIFCMQFIFAIFGLGAVIREGLIS